MNLFKYQEDAIAFGVDRDRCLLALDPGLGKTIVALKILEIRKLSKLGNILVILPASLRTNFRREVEKWGMDSDRFIIESYEWLIKKMESGLSWIKNIAALVVDECQDHLRNKDSKRTLAIWELSKWIKNIYFLSGTPVKKSSTDLYAVLRICEGAKKWGTYSQFAAKYAVRQWNPHKRGFEYTGFKNSALLKENIQQCMIRYKKTEVQEQLPKLLEGCFFVENIGNGLCTDVSYAELLKDKKQLTAKQLEHISMVRKITAFGKVRVYLDSLEKRGVKRGIIFVWHKVIGEKVAEVLKCPFISGDIKADDRLLEIDKFENKEVDWLVITISSAGVGYNISSAKYVAFFELPFTYAEVEQSYSRVWRIGNKACTVEYVLMENSIDEAIYGLCMNRKYATRRIVG
jgi:SNF2 family DNA or RNA helicase